MGGGVHKRGCFHSSSIQLAMGGLRCWSSLSFTNLLVNIGEEQKKALPALQVHNFGLFCVVDILKDFFYWLLQEKPSQVTHRTD